MKQTTRVTYIIIYLILMSEFTNCFLEKSPRVLWRRTTSKVVTETNIYHINILLTTMCDAWNVTTPNESNFTKNNRLDFHARCLSLVEPAIIYPLKTFDYQFNEVFHGRQKRELGSLAGSMVSLLGTGGGALASNPIGWIIGAALVVSGIVCFGIWSAWKVTKVEERTSHLEIQFDKQHKLLSTIIHDLDEIKNKTNSLSSDFKNLVETYAQFTSLASYITAKIQIIERDLIDGLEGLKLGKVNHKFFKALNLTLPCSPNCEFAENDLLEFKLINDSSLYVSILAHKSSPKFEVLEADAFQLISKNETHTCSLTYAGEKLLMFNATNWHEQVGSSCRLSLITHKSSDLFTLNRQLCGSKGHGWETHTCLPNNLHPGARIQVKYDRKKNTIYCFGHNITVGTTNITCPDHPFSLPITTSFTFPHYKYEGMPINYTLSSYEQMKEIHMNFHTYNLTNPYEIKSKVDEVDMSSFEKTTRVYVTYKISLPILVIFLLVITGGVLYIRKLKKEVSNKVGEIELVRRGRPEQRRRPRGRSQSPRHRSYSPRSRKSDIPPADY